jgi:hypothetical protein
VRADLERDGYCVIEGVVPAGMCRAVTCEIERFLGVGLAKPATFTACPPENEGIVPLHHTQAQWNVRQHPRLHEVFAELWGSERLWVSFDRAVFRVPAPELQGGAPPRGELLLHWDRDPRLPERCLQGMLYLEDTPQGCGGTAVAPAIFSALAELLKGDRVSPTDWTIAARPSEWQVATAPAGSLVVWDSRMPHGASPNTSGRPRVSQAVTMFPPELFGEDVAARLAMFLSKQVPEVWRGLVGQVHPEPGEPAALTPLGRKLVGFDPW